MTKLAMDKHNILVKEETRTSAPHINKILISMIISTIMKTVDFHDFNYHQNMALTTQVHPLDKYHRSQNSSVLNTNIKEKKK